ncbi:MAG: VCBS repeat-containing protein [Bacteroidetes bacterium]|nr:VCBS repeat-containing protein [Bacteroidota bacterium]
MFKQKVLNGFFFTAFLVIGVFLFIVTQTSSAQTQIWVEDSFEDFSDGKLDASGQNIYISRDGKIRTIHRFDLNDDGYIDLLFNSTHNDYAFIPASMATVDQNREIKTGQLAVEGSIKAEVADLNRDGYLDVLFCPNPSGIQHSRRFITIIWGGEDGWPSHRSNGILPVQGIKALALADLNHDQWPDIVTINSEAWLPGQPEGNIVRVFWGNEQGFLLTRFQDIGVSQAVELTAGDFDADGADDIALLTGNGVVQFIWAQKSGNNVFKLAPDKIKLPGDGVLSIMSADLDLDGKFDLVVGSGKKQLYIIKGKSGRDWDKVTAISGFDASHIAVGNLDDDKYPDIVLCYFSLQRAAGGEMMGGSSGLDKFTYILWGSKKGFSASAMTKLEAQYNIASAIADIDGDRNHDLIVAIHQGEKVYATESVVFFGIGNRQFEKSQNGIPSEGAYHVAVASPEGKQPQRVIISNSRGGNLREEVPLLLYWGAEDGFDPKRCTEIPFRSGYEATAADFNADGFVDLVAIDELHGGQAAASDEFAGANIYWGSEKGFDFIGERTVITEVNLGTSNIADLNSDGYLDLVLGQFEPGEFGADSTAVIIYYGAKDGYHRSRRAAILSPGRSNSPMIADYNKDGLLDIAVNSFLNDCVRIFWAGSDGFNKNRQTVLNVPSVIDLETADLNKDGYLDIIACSYYDRITKYHDTGVLIFWGSEKGFKQWNAQRLPGITPIGPVVADFDNDGYLDLFNSHYHGELHRELLPGYLYWGGVDGFHTRRRTALVNNSGADGFAADFDRDGLLDLVAVNHSIDGNHNKAVSKVYYNDGDRFNNPQRIEYLPSPGAHWSWGEDMGHIYNRSFEQFYESSVYKWKKSFKQGEVSFAAEIPEGTELKIAVRSAKTEEKLNDKEWETVSDKFFSLKKEDRCIQYKAIFISDNGDRFPVLDSIKIEIGK